MEKRTCPLISIIVPAFNVEEYLEECVESIRSQTFTNFELILVDDGSTDGTGAICDSYKKTDARIKVIHQANAGLSQARNAGIDIATGEYLSFVDADDYIHSQMMDSLYQLIIGYEADVAVCDYQNVYDGVAPGPVEQKETHLLSSKEAVQAIVRDSDTKMIVACGKLYRRDLFFDIRYPKGKYHEDEFVTYRLFYDAYSVVVTDAQYYYYRQRENSITKSRYCLKRLDKLAALKECMEFFNAQADQDLRDAARARYLINVQIAYYRVKRELKGQRKVLKKLKHEHRAYYGQFKKSKICGARPVDGMTILLFHFFPILYYVMAGFYVKMQKNN